jgi:hypothetical protein
MKCEIQYLERVPENFPKNEVDSYRVEQSEDDWLYLRFDLHRNRITSLLLKTE